MGQIWAFSILLEEMSVEEKRGLESFRNQAHGLIGIVMQRIVLTGKSIDEGDHLAIFKCQREPDK